MNSFRPSRYISNSDYATYKTLDIISDTLTIPNSVSVTNADRTYSIDLRLPTTRGIGWRSIVTSSNAGFGIHTPSFLIPCKLSMSGASFDTFVYGEVFRNSPSTIRFQIVFTGISGGGTYSEMGGEYGVKLQPIISPFEP